MIKVMIVDDELSHIQGLVRHVRWKELGYDSPLTAESGEEALAVLAHTPIDVLISDVSMPIMTGIELVAKFKAHNPQIQALMISGYNEFDFVQEAIHVGAQAYVLKPLKIEEVEQKLAAFRATFDKLGHIAEQMNELHEKLSNSLETVKDRFVVDLLEETEDDRNNMASWRRILDLPQMITGIRLIIFGLDGMLDIGQEANDKIVLGPTLMKTVSVILSDYTQLYLAKMGLYRVVAVHLNPTPGEMALIENQLRLIHNVMKEQYGASVTIGVSRTGDLWSEAHVLYKEVKFMLARARLFEGDQILHYNRWDQSDFDDYRLSNELIPKIVNLTEKGSMKQVADLLDHVFDLIISQERHSFTYVQAFGMGLLSELARNQKSNKASSGDWIILIWRQLIDCRNTDEVKTILNKYVNEYMIMEHNDRVNHQHNLIHKISEFIKTHLRDNMTVRQIAELHQLNASYLSVLFKREMGQTISDYVHDARMNKAKELLQDPNIKIYEVAEQLGFQSPAYFTYLFKKFMGCTPQNYRDFRSPGRERSWPDRRA